MAPLPENFVRTMQELYGERGVLWVQQLPRLIAECEQHLELQVQPHFANLSYNFVAPAVQHDGAPVVLKLSVPNKEFTSEIEALRLYAGRGICHLLFGDPDQGILLLERLQPGVMLATVTDDAQATAITAQVMRQLWQPAPAEHTFPTVAKWGKGLERLRAEFDGGTGPFPQKLVEQAEQLFAELGGSMNKPMLLHGDLHHFNILGATREPWLAIDPKGLVGEPAYETGALLRNPDSRIILEPRVQARRVDQLADLLALDRERILGWGVAQAVLSGWWSYEDHGHGWEPALQLAELLAGLMR